MQTLLKQSIIGGLSFLLLTGIAFSVGSSEPSVFDGQASEVETLVKTISFDSADGFSSSTTYAGSRLLTSTTDATEKFYFHQGNIVSSSPFSSSDLGSKLRVYTSASTSRSNINAFLEYRKNITNVTKIIVNASRGAATSVALNAYYSSDSAETTISGTGPASYTSSTTGSWNAATWNADPSSNPKSISGTLTDYTFIVNSSGLNNIRFKLESSVANVGAESQTDININNIRVYGMVTFGTLADVAITTPSSDLSFYVGEKFSAPSLVLTAYDGANQGGVSKIVTPSSYSPSIDYVFTGGDVNATYVVTVSYTENAVTESTTYNISVLAVDTTEDNLSILVADFTTVSYAANNGEKTKTAADSVGSIKYFTNQVYQSNSFIQFQASNGYIYNISDLVSIDRIVIDLGAGSSSLVIKEGINISDAQAGTTISPTASGNLRIYSFSSNKGYFNISNGASLSTVLSIKVYTDTSVSEVTTYINDSMTALDIVCSSDGNSNTTNLQSTWSTLASDYSSLSADAKNYIYDNADDTNVSAFRARYQFIRSKYAYTNFLVNSSNVTLYARNPNTPIRSNDFGFNGSSLIILLFVIGSGLLVGFKFSY